MRCPKCHYLSFDPEPRCKNCGYDLEVADADLALHMADADAEVEMPDLTLHERPTAAAPMTLELVHAGAGSRSAVAERKPRKKKRDSGSRFTIVEEPVDDEYQEPAFQLDRVEDVEDGFQPEAEPEVTEAETPHVAEAAQEREIAEPAQAPAPVAAAAAAAESVAPAPEPVAAPSPSPSPSAPLALVPEPETQPEPVRIPFRAPDTSTEMPLFVKGIADSDLRAEVMSLTSEDAPIVPPTRPPLAVRRAAVETPARSQQRPDRRLGPLDHDLLEDLKRVEREEAVRERELARSTTSETEESADQPVEPGRRLAAAGIDIAVLGGIAAFVFWATLRLCNVSVSAVGWAALIPFVIFIGVMDLSYLLMFTAAGGQTPGKMLMHLRVVGDDRPADTPVPLGRAAWRSALTMVSLVVLGLGWLPALFGRGLTLHDRLAHTRVVRV